MSNFILRSLCVFGFVYSFALYSQTPNDWSGGLSGSASRFRADTGVTNPIFYSLPVWSRVNAVDLDVIARNPALLSAVDDNRRRWTPVSLQGFVRGSAYDLVQAFDPPGPQAQKILDDLESDDNQLQRIYTAAHSYYVMQNFAYSLHYIQQRNIWLEGDPETLYYQSFKDIWLQLSSGGQIFDSETSGRLDFGASFKGIVRIGAEKARERSSVISTTQFTPNSFLEQGMGLGFDYSLLWSSSDFESRSWGFQVALVGKDVGTTRFIKAEPFFELLGYTVPRTRPFPVIPNDTILGLGVKLPNFRDGFRSALRVEWNYWTRPIPSSKKWAVSYELRFPYLASFYSGFRGGAFTGGVGLRFRGFELDVGSFTDLWGNGSQLVERRAWMMELRSAF